MGRLPSTKHTEALVLLSGGLSTARVAATVGVTASAVGQWARAHGVARTRSAASKLAWSDGTIDRVAHREACCTYTLDESAFEKDLTPASAWLLGLIAGDGCIVQEHALLRGLDLLGDEDVCLKAAKILGSNAPAHDHRKYKHSASTHSIRFNSTKLAESLAAFGFTPNKARTLPWPNISDALLPHFVRGLLDSDGCVTYAKQKGRKTRYPVITFRMVPKAFMERLQRVVHEVTGSEAELVPGGDGCWVLAVSCANARRFGEWLWKDSTPETRGARKYAYFRLLVQEAEQVKIDRATHWSGLRQSALTLYAADGLAAEIGKALGIHKKVVERWAREAGIVRSRSVGMVPMKHRRLQERGGAPCPEQD